MKTVLFDLDGTLLDTLEDLTDSVNFTFEKMGLGKREKYQVRKALGNGVERLLSELLGEENLSLLPTALSIFRPYYKEHSAVKTAPFPGVCEVIEKLQKQGVLCGIVSNKPNEAVEELKKEFFPFVALAAGEKKGIPRKPDPTPLYAALDEMGGNRENCLYIGDSEVDILTAKNAGFPCIAMTWGFRDREELLLAGAENLADNAEELYEKIMELL